MSAILVNRREILGNEKGAELVELAMVLPLFLALIIGVIEFGRAYNIYQNVIHATREGVRAAVSDCLTGGNCTPGSYSTLSDTEIRNRIRDDLRAINIDVPNPGDIVVDSSTPLTVAGFKSDPASSSSSTFNRNIEVFNVRVNYTHNFLFLGRIVQLLAPGSTVGSGSIVISTTVEMIDERFA